MSTKTTNRVTVVRFSGRPGIPVADPFVEVPAGRVPRSGASMILYPRLSKQDSRVWSKFVEVSPIRFDRAIYDVRVGIKAMPEHITDPVALDMWAKVTRKRIDVVGFRSGQTWLIEVKPLGGVSALGQLLVYDILYRATFPTAQNIVKCVVCGRVDAEMPEIFTAYGCVVLVADVEGTELREFQSVGAPVPAGTQ